jgi:hypothetical protein
MAVIESLDFPVTGRINAAIALPARFRTLDVRTGDDDRCASALPRPRFRFSGVPRERRVSTP